ncbi:MAG TPA: hypothetical protein VNG33_16935 [Polyangiaceae bacterium]|nr:hypothetical protein [Polyangiaceae bacterium]
MSRSARLLTLAAALTEVVTACSPRVVIAHDQQPGGSDGAATAGALEPARVLADSVADFSLTQGEHGWYYGYDSGSLDSFALMTRISVITTYVPATADVWDCWANDTTHWAQLFQLGGHPNGTDTSPPSPPILQRVVRRWLSSFEGDVTIAGELAKIDVTLGSNGIDGSVYVDGTERYTAFIGGEDGGGLSYEVSTGLKLGSTVDFVLDPHDGDDHSDLSRFTAVIVRQAPTSP